jgi:hypothetical protein
MQTTASTGHELQQLTQSLLVCLSLSLDQINQQRKSAQKYFHFIE